MFAQHRRQFWLVTSETPETFHAMFRNILPSMFSRQRKRNFTLSPRNRLLLTLIWLRHYPTYPMLSLMFDISESSVGKILENTWISLWEHYSQNVRWHSVQKWQSLIGKWTEMPNIVGVIDGTSREIEIPTENQELFYSGHRKYHCIHTQIIIDNERNIVYVHSGFCGHENDGTAFHTLPSLGPNQPLEFPANVRLLADAIHPSNYPLVTHYKSSSIRNQPIREQRRRKKFNRNLRSRRVYVEHVIKDVKLFKVIGSLYRHPRFYLSSIVELCAGLAKRKMDLLREV